MCHLKGAATETTFEETSWKEMELTQLRSGLAAGRLLVPFPGPSGSLSGFTAGSLTPHTALRRALTVRLTGNSK